MKLVCAVIAGILLAPQQAKNANKDLHYDEAAGISWSKPAKNDEWDFKEKGFFDKCKMALNHKVDEIGFDVLFQPPATNGGSYDLKKVAEEAFTNMSGQQGVSEPKRVEVKQIKMPGLNVPASYLEMTYKRADKVQEFRQWSFIAKENQQLYLIILHGEEGMYKKHQKVADYIVASIKTWKLPK
jgi:hypothetical protein